MGLFNRSDGGGGGGGGGGGETDGPLTRPRSGKVAKKSESQKKQDELESRAPSKEQLDRDLGNV